jgi:ketosteroid isomerase-like protein
MTSDQTTPPATDPRAVVRRYLAALQAGDQRAVRALFAPDATWQLRGDLPMSGTWRGRDAILGEFLATALAAYEPGSLGLQATGLFADGDHVVLEWISRARTRAGDPYENHCIGVFAIRDGRIQAVREYMDTLYAQRVAFSPRPAGTTVAQLLLAPDPAALEALLAGGARFHSPVADYEGADVARLLSLIPTVLDDLRIRRQLPSERELVSVLTGRAGERSFDAILDERYDEAGALADVTLTLRPLAALRAAVALMGAALDEPGR